MKEGVYRRYLLGVLLIILAFNYVDRLALGLLLQDVKTDLHVSDTQLGLLSGIAFAFFYSIMGVPIARWADRGNRVLIISVTTALWAMAVATCGIAGSFIQLMLIRVVVAVGEAGCVPPAHSFIADHFTRAERPRAVAIYMLGTPLSAVIGYFLAGWLNEFYGWRITFMLLGLPGIALAAVAWFTLREPRLSKPVVEPVSATAVSSKVVAPASLMQVCRNLWSNRTFRHLLLSHAVAVLFSAGSWKWQPAFFIRSHGLNTGELGIWFALIYGVGGFLGTYLGGEWAVRRVAQNERLQLRMIVFVYTAFAVLSTFIYLTATKYVAFGLMGVAAIGLGMTVGPFFATIQTVVPQRMRAVSIALVYLFSNLIGLGLGPLAVGIMSDVLRPAMGEESLRYALLAMCPGYFWAAWHMWRASNSVAKDVARAQADEDGVMHFEARRAPAVSLLDKATTPSAP